jgi:hypothetical protein
MPWAGEFAGKHLTASVLVYRATGDKRLLAATKGFVREFIAAQDADGYLGPFPKKERLTGETATATRSGTCGGALPSRHRAAALARGGDGATTRRAGRPVRCGRCEPCAR